MTSGRVYDAAARLIDRGKALTDRLGASVSWRAERTRRRAVEEVLRREAAPDTRRAEVEFVRLQGRPWPRATYEYDEMSLWDRAVQRHRRLLGMLDGQGRRQSILEVGCGDGLTGVLLAAFGHVVTLADLDDRRDVRAVALPSAFGSIDEGLPFPPGGFDLVYSYNTIEHLPDPASALREFIRVCRPGGRIFLDFGPLYCSPWGLHAYRTIHAPYSQFLFSRDFIDRQLEQLGVVDLGGRRAALQPLNEWRHSQYAALWTSSTCRILDATFGAETRFLDLVMEFPEAFQGRGLTIDDVVTSHHVVLLSVPDGEARS